ncbi:hypothetical protein LINPERPRIM_LOCUS17182 [Linum perenne]
MGNNNTSGFQGEENSNRKIEEEEAQGKSAQEAVTTVTDTKDDAGVDGDQISDGATESGKDSTGSHFVVQSKGSGENGERMLGSEKPKAEEGAEGQNQDGKEQEEERLESQVHDSLPDESEEAKPVYEAERSKDNTPQLNILREETEEHKSDSIEQQESHKPDEAEMLISGSTVMSPAHDQQEHQISDEVESNLNENEGNSTSTNMERLVSQVNDPLAAESKEAKLEYDGEISKGCNPEPNTLREEMKERKSDLDEQLESHKSVEAEMLSIGSPLMSPSHDELDNHGSDVAELKLNENEGNSTSIIMFPSTKEEDPDSEELESNLNEYEGNSTSTIMFSTKEEDLDSEELESNLNEYEGNSTSTIMFSTKGEDLDSEELKSNLNEYEGNSTSTIMFSTKEEDLDSEELESNLNEGNSTSTIMFSTKEEDPDSKELESNLNEYEGSITESSFAHTDDSENNQHLEVHTSYAHDGAIIAENLEDGFSENKLTISLPTKMGTEVKCETAVESGTAHHEPDSRQMNYDSFLESQAEANLMAKHDHSNGDDEESFSNQAGRMIHGEEISLLKASKPEANPISTSLLPGVIEEAQESDMAGNNQDHQSENGSQLDCSFMSEFKSNGSQTEAASEEQKMEVPQMGIPIIDGQKKEHEPTEIHNIVAVMKEHTETPQNENGKEESEPHSSPDQEEESVSDSPQDISSNSSWEFNTGNSSEFFVDMGPTFLADKLTDEEEPVPFPFQLQAAVTVRKEETNQQLQGMSTDSAPENLSIDSQIQKSPSFNIELLHRRQSTEDYSDQTPLLRKYQDKNTVTSASKETKSFKLPNQEGAMSMEEKRSQTLVKSDSEKSRTPLFIGWMKEGNDNEVDRHNKASKEEMTKSVPCQVKEKQYSRRRSTIFGSCLCCTATNAIS